MNQEEFQTFFAAKLKDRGLTLARLSELSGISVKHLDAMQRGDFQRAPAAPYLRAYFIRVGKILGFAGEAYWKHLEESGLVQTSGIEDRLPKNRFAGKPVKARVAAALVAVLLVLYFGFRFSSIFGKPRLTVLAPREQWTNVKEDRIVIRGELENGDRLTVNNEPVVVRDDGGFEKSILLQPGLNTVEVAAKKFLGRETKALRQIFYEPSAGSLPEATSTMPVSR